MENRSRTERVPRTFLGPGLMPPDHAAACQAEDAREAVWSGASRPAGLAGAHTACPLPPLGRSLVSGAGTRGRLATAAALLSQRGCGPPGSSSGSACEGGGFLCREAAPSVSSAAHICQQWLKHPLFSCRRARAALVGAGVKPGSRLCGGARGAHGWHMRSV